MEKTLPPAEEMFLAIADNDSRYDGLFFFGVVTTGVFCRPSCRARKPLPENVRYFTSPADALLSGFRPCKLCRPSQPAGQLPEWLAKLFHRLDSEPGLRLANRELEELGASAQRVRRWFLQNYGITFQHFQRCRRLSSALDRLAQGSDVVTVALDAGYQSLSGFNEAFQKWCGCSPKRAALSESKVLLADRYLSPLGPMLMIADRDKLFLLEFADRNDLSSQCQRLAEQTGRPICPGQNSRIIATQGELDRYFSGELKAFQTPVELVGTDFQKSVWTQLLQIPFGKTTSYETIARQLGKPNAARAVGRANGSNRLAIVIPCHRVIRNDGQLSGYAGGLRRKEWLLDMENASIDDSGRC